MSRAQREITASQFKARCLRLLDEVAETGETLVVTKHGKPVARVEPPARPSIRAGSLDPQDFHGDPIDRLIYATAVEHDARLVTADKRLRQFDPERMVW